MAVIAYTVDLTTITDAQTTTGWSALGGGGAGLTAEVDFAIQDVAGTLLSLTKQVSGASGATKGMIFDNGATITNTAGVHFFTWIYCATPGILDSLSLGGVRITAGTGTGAYHEYYIEGNDTYAIGGQRNVAIRYNGTGAAPSPGSVTGSPGADLQWLGGQIKVTTTSKSINLGIDVLRYGTGFFLTGGTGADPEGTFAGIAAINDATANQYGLFSDSGGTFSWKGRLVIGQDNTAVATAAEFLDATGATILIEDSNFAEVDFTQIRIDHASTIVNITGATIKALGTNDPGQIQVLNATADVNFTGCVFESIGVTVLTAASNFLTCAWKGCDTITAEGADLSGSSIEGYEVAADTSPLIWNVATDPNGLLDNMSFTKGTALTHAIEFGLLSPLTMTLTGCDFSGYGATTSTSATFHVLRTTGTVTINIVGGSGPVTYKSAGADVVIVQNPVAFQVTVTDVTDGTPISGARVLVLVTDTGTGSLPFEISVSILSDATTATVTHTAHGLSNGDPVQISGANEEIYNGVFIISNVTTNTYDYSIGIDSPADVGTMWTRWETLTTNVLVPTTPGTATNWANNDTDAVAGAALDWDDANVDPYHIIGTPSTVAGDGHEAVYLSVATTEGFRINLRDVSLSTEEAALQAMEIGCVYGLVSWTGAFSQATFFGAGGQFTGRYLRFGINGSGNLYAALSRPGTHTAGIESWTGETAISASTDYVVAFEQDGTSMKIYLDGVPEIVTYTNGATGGTGDDPGNWFADVQPVQPVNGISIGMFAESDGGGTGGTGWNGKIKEVGMYTTVPGQSAQKELSSYLHEVYDNATVSGATLATAGILFGTTDGSGVLNDGAGRSYPTNQDYVGRVRSSSTSIYYKTSPLGGTLDKDIGVDIGIALVRDE